MAKTLKIKKNTRSKTNEGSGKLRLEAGKRYWRRDEALSGVLEPSCAFAGALVDEAHKWIYRPNGLVIGSRGHQKHDLVAECSDTFSEGLPPKLLEDVGVSVGRRDSAYFEVLKETKAELDQAIAAYPPFNSAHEGYAVLLEEVDELWAEVRAKQGTWSRPELIKREAIQVAAMALRLILDCCEKNGAGYGK
jgi:hypothetical protein